MRLMLNGALSYLLFFAAGCTDTKVKPPEVAEEKKVKITIERFDKELFTLDRSDVASGVSELHKKYPAFLPRFGQMLNIGKPGDSSFAVNIGHFVSDAEVRKVYEETSTKYKDLEDVEQSLSEGFTYYSHYFPSLKIPRAISFVSGFNYAIAVGEDFVAAGLDMYMGPEYRYYKLLQFPNFKLPFMNREYIAADMMRGWIATEFPNEDKSTELLNSMIHEGKIMYLNELLFPSMEDSLRSGFNAAQLEWLGKNEKRIWGYIIDQKLLFSTNFTENARYLNEAPFSPGMPKESPGRAVVWIGYKIVKAYMNKHPEMTPEKLMKLKDSRMILNSSGYKPMK